LIEQFTEKEIKEALDVMKTNTTPGPDGFPTSFYKAFWEQIKETIL
jgi:hypothetical protein